MEKVLLSDMKGFAKKIVAQIESAPPLDHAFVLALSGDLGAGKTTFTQALAKELWIKDTIQSPTYVLMKSYAVPPPPAGGWLENFIHIDAYRLEDPLEFKTLKPEEFLSNPHTLVVVEWPERLGSLLPTPDLSIKFSSEGASTEERYIELI